MKSTTKYVGLDVHQATTLATVRETCGKIIARSILPTEEAALLEFFAGMRGAVNVAFEEGTHPWFASVRPERLPHAPSDQEPKLEVTHAEEDCSEGPRAPRSLARGGG